MPVLAADGGKPAHPPAGAPLEPAQASLESMQSAQLPFTDAADEIMDFAKGHKLDGYSSVRIDRDAQRVVVLWHGQPPQSILGVIQGIRSDGIRVDVVTSTYDLAELDAEERRLMGLNKTALGVRITAVEPLPDHDGVLVSVAPVDIGRAPALVRSSFKLVFKPMATTLPVYGRWDDTAPFWAGALIYDSGFFSDPKSCTSGFSVEFPTSGFRGLLTANHCGQRNWGTAPPPYRHVGLSGPGWTTVDATLVSGESYGESVYTSSGYQGNTARNVISGGDPAVGTDVIASGAGSGASTVRVYSDNGYVYSDDGYLVGPGFWTNNLYSVASIGSGDSGGPTITLPTAGARARGMIDAIDPGGTYVGSCTGWQSPLRTCSMHAFHVGINVILLTLGVTLRTSP